VHFLLLLILQASLQDLEGEEADLSTELATLQLEYTALHQNTSLMEQQLETQQVLLHALTGHRQVRPQGSVTGFVLQQQTQVMGPAALEGVCLQSLKLSVTSVACCFYHGCKCSSVTAHHGTWCCQR
jgi:hypothetical protein